MSRQMPADSVQMQLIRRYSRILREKQGQYRGSRIGARDRRLAAEAARKTAAEAAQRVVGVVPPPGARAT